MVASAIADTGIATDNSTSNQATPTMQQDQSKSNNANNMNLSSINSTSGLATVQVCFTSRDASLAKLLPNNAFTLPVTVARRELSEIIHQIIKQHSDEMEDENDNENEDNDESSNSISQWLKRPFDFVIDNHFLTSNLLLFLQRYNLTGESQLQVEILTSLPAPQQQEPTTHPDWIASLDTSSSELNMTQQPFVITACYDGRVRIIDAKTHSILSEGIGHTSAVKSVTYLQSSSSSSNNSASRSTIHHLISTGADRTVRLWQYDSKHETCKQLQTSSTIHHTDTVECSIALSQSNKVSFFFACKHVQNT
jgi:WD40 repeat protein